MPRSLRFQTLLPAALVALASCAPLFRAAVAPDELPRRLVLALDGVDYRDMVAARERGLFGAFRPPSRLVSTFPSISDIAWHEIFGVLPPRGYQRIYYSHAANAMIGGPLDAIRPIEYEERMDLAFGTKLHHLGAYLLSGTVSRREIDVAADRLLETRGRASMYVYNVGPDALQHTRGDLDAYLAHLDQRLVRLQRDYRARAGRELEIVLLSDHGHNHAAAARFLPVADALASRGFRVASSMTGPRDVAFSVDGVTTGFGVFCDPTMRDSVARTLADLSGVELVSTQIAPDRFRVEARDSVGVLHTAVVERRAGAGERAERFRYTPASGDPLRYAALLPAMRAAGAFDADDFAAADAWLRATADQYFPAAPVRIARGHTTVTLNPAPILVSVDAAYRIGLGAVSIANRMRPLGGTHGALSASSALGVLMTNFVTTRDDLTSTVRHQLGGFDDLREPVMPTSYARVVRTADLRRDRFDPFGAGAAALPVDDAPALELLLSPDDARRLGPGAAMVVTVRAVVPRPGNVDVTEFVGVERWPLSAALVAGPSARRRYLVALDRPVFRGLRAGATYRVSVRVADRTGSIDAGDATLYTDREGHIRAY